MAHWGQERGQGLWMTAGVQEMQLVPKTVRELVQMTVQELAGTWEAAARQWVPESPQCK